MCATFNEFIAYIKQRGDLLFEPLTTNPRDEGTVGENHVDEVSAIVIAPTYDLVDSSKFA